jgi:uncharacterized membrane protein
MEPPQSPPPPPASPFDPNARPKTGGCPKPLLIGCLIVFILGGLGLAGAIYYASKNIGKIMTLSLNQAEAAVLNNLADDVTPEERQRLREAFYAARQRAATATSEEIARDGQALNFKILDIANKKKGKLNRRDVQDLTETLERFAGGGSSPPPGPR